MLFADRVSLFISVDKFRQNLTWRIPMKIASILAGVAVAALSVSAASAQTIHKGQSSLTGAAYLTGNNVVPPLFSDPVGYAVAVANNAAGALNAELEVI